MNLFISTMKKNIRRSRPTRGALWVFVFLASKIVDGVLGFILIPFGYECSLTMAWTEYTVLREIAKRRASK